MPHHDELEIFREYNSEEYLGIQENIEHNDLELEVIGETVGEDIASDDSIAAAEREIHRRRALCRIFHFLDKLKTWKQYLYQFLMMFLVIASFGLSISQTQADTEFGIGRLVFETLISIWIIVEYFAMIFCSNSLPDYVHWYEFMISYKGILKCIIMISSIGVVVTQTGVGLHYNYDSMETIYGDCLLFFSFIRLLRFEATLLLCPFILTLFVRYFVFLSLVMYFGFVVVMFYTCIESYFLKDDAVLDAQDIFDSIYWSAITLTTVGYGDFLPDGTDHEATACIAGIIGVCLLSIPAGLFGSIIVFEREKTRDEEHQSQLKRDLASYSIQAFIKIELCRRKYGHDSRLYQHAKFDFRAKLSRFITENARMDIKNNQLNYLVSIVSKIDFLEEQDFNFQIHGRPSTYSNMRPSLSGMGRPAFYSSVGRPSSYSKGRPNTISVSRPSVVALEEGGRGSVYTSATHSRGATAAARASYSGPMSKVKSNTLKPTTNNNMKEKGTERPSRSRSNSYDPQVHAKHIYQSYRYDPNLKSYDTNAYKIGPALRPHKENVVTRVDNSCLDSSKFETRESQNHGKEKSSIVDENKSNGDNIHDTHDNIVDDDIHVTRHSFDDDNILDTRNNIYDDDVTDEIGDETHDDDDVNSNSL